MSELNRRVDALLGRVRASSDASAHARSRQLIAPSMVSHSWRERHMEQHSIPLPCEEGTFRPAVVEKGGSFYPAREVFYEGAWSILDRHSEPAKDPTHAQEMAEATIRENFRQAGAPLQMLPAKPVIHLEYDGYYKQVPLSTVEPYGSRPRTQRVKASKGKKSYVRSKARK